MSRAKISLKGFGFKEVQKSLELTDKQTKAAAMRGVRLVLTKVVERSRANAPILSGDLRISLRKSRVYQKTTVDGALFHGNIEMEGAYGLKMHEQLTPAGPYQLGPVSSVQPMTPEGGVGGKFVERSVLRNAALLGRLLATEFIKELEGIRKK